MNFKSYLKLSENAPEKRYGFTEHIDIGSHACDSYDRGLNEIEVYKVIPESGDLHTVCKNIQDMFDGVITVKYPWVGKPVVHYSSGRVGTVVAVLRKRDVNFCVGVIYTIDPVAEGLKPKLGLDMPKQTDRAKGKYHHDRAGLTSDVSKGISSGAEFQDVIHKFPQVDKGWVGGSGGSTGRGPLGSVRKDKKRRGSARPAQTRTSNPLS